jgi:hypothetical protein
VGFVMKRLTMSWAILAALVLLVAGNVGAAIAREDGRERPFVAREDGRERPFVAREDGHKRPGDAPTAAQIAACAPDAQRLCLQHFGSREAIRACMIAHVNQLSETCKAAFR